MAFTLRLAAHVNEGLPGKEHFSVVETPAPSSDDVPEGGILVQVRLHPSQRPSRAMLLLLFPWLPHQTIFPRPSSGARLLCRPLSALRHSLR